MIYVIAKSIVLAFGLFIIFAGFIMLFTPKRAQSTVRKAGSTPFINYAEITIRLIPAVALILHSEYARSPLAFKGLGWFMLFTSVVLYIVPREMHHRYATKSSELLKPVYFRLISLLAFIFGAYIIYNTL